MGPRPPRMLGVRSLSCARPPWPGHRLRLGAERAVVLRRIPSVLHKDGFHLPVDPTDSNCKLRGSVAFAASWRLTDGGDACRQRLQVEGPDVGVKCAWPAVCRGATRGACAVVAGAPNATVRDTPRTFTHSHLPATKRWRRAGIVDSTSQQTFFPQPPSPSANPVPHQ